MRESQILEARPFTPDPPSSSVDWPNIFNTPLTICTLQRQANVLQSTDLPLSTRHDLGKFIKGSLTIATTGQLMTEHVERSQAAENARKLRQRQNCRIVQKGGVIYAKDAKHIAQERESNELEAARTRLARLEQAAVKKRQRRVRQVVWNRFKKKLANRDDFIKDLDKRMALVCAEMLNWAEEDQEDVV